jgi:O-antigen/teichoic acid export membrane protein
MANLKALFKDTVIYGVSSIVGRFLNYLLVPLYTFKISAESGGYGVVTNLYAYTALILVILTFGMETTFFRFANKEGADARKVFSTSLFVVTFLSVIFLAAVFGFITPICNTLGKIYTQHHEYVLLMASCVALDAIQAIPFSYLRYKKRPIKFASLKLLFIFLNIALNLLYFIVLPNMYAKNPDSVAAIYDPNIGAGYVFILNFICTSLITFFFFKEFKDIKCVFDKQLIKQMFTYSWPILVLGVAGILNQAADKIIFPLVYPDESQAQPQLGIYGACVKIAMIMAMITQAFRYAYEPFVFGNDKDKNSKESYALAMKYFIIFTLLAFLCVIGYMDILQRIIGPGYREGLKVVPIVMAAEIMMGVTFNLSFWYKLVDKTLWGAVISIAGCIVLFAVNLIFIPKYSYMACAWGGFAGYATTMLLSYFLGQKYNPVKYPLKDIAFYTLFAAVLFVAMTMLPKSWAPVLRIAVNTVLILLFTAVIVKKDLIRFIRRRK